jgi:hypothetical protein
VLTVRGGPVFQDGLFIKSAFDVKWIGIEVIKLVNAPTIVELLGDGV